MKSIAGFVVLALLTCCCAAAGAADVYPSRIVKFLVPQAPGGATDVFARKMAQLLSERWGQPVIVENRAGAAGVVGTEAVARSAPDGYTLLVTYAGSQAVNPSLLFESHIQLRQGFSNGCDHCEHAIHPHRKHEPADQNVARFRRACPAKAGCPDVWIFRQRLHQPTARRNAQTGGRY